MSPSNITNVNCPNDEFEESDIDSDVDNEFKESDIETDDEESEQIHFDTTKRSDDEQSVEN